jgi:hypothetical protein
MPTDPNTDARANPVGAEPEALMTAEDDWLYGVSVGGDYRSGRWQL